MDLTRHFTIETPTSFMEILFLNVLKYLKYFIGFLGILSCHIQKYPNICGWKTETSFSLEKVKKVKKHYEFYKLQRHYCHFPNTHTHTHTQRAKWCQSGRQAGSGWFLSSGLFSFYRNGMLIRGQKVSYRHHVTCVSWHVSTLHPVHPHIVLTAML